MILLGSVQHDMGFLDFLLNVAALLLWLNWRAAGFTKHAPPAGISIIRTLKRAEPARSRRWASLSGLAALLLLRGVLYSQVGSALNWTAHWQLGVTSLPFRSDYVGQMWLYSLFSFGRTLFVFYLWLGLLSILNRRVDDSQPWQRLVRLHLGALERLPALGWFLLPLLGVLLFWLLSQPLFRWLQMLPAGVSWNHIVQQGVIIGLAAFLSWKYLLLGLLLLHVLSSYIYFGKSLLWPFIETSARNLLAPLRFLPLVAGWFDFAPLFAAVIIGVGAHFALASLAEIYKRLPL